MEELAVKKDFTNIYTQKFPNSYLKEMKRLDYRIPDKTKPLYLSIVKQLYRKLSKKINIIDIGSSYGINSALMKYNLTMSDLDDFFLKEEPSIEQSKQFFDQLSSDDSFEFYQIDISEPALKFSENVDLCKKGICVNLETGNLPIKELPHSDMIIATGCIGYIGYKAFSNIFELIKKQNSEENLENSDRGPVFAFSVLRIFDMADIEKTFDHYGYSLAKTDVRPIRQRRFSDLQEKQKTLSLLHDRGLDTKWLEDDGHFYADFYIASPKKLEKQLVTLSKDLKKHQ
ncbi:hypothetical protein AAA799E16_00941 [Marine Group I thaumarchaeote SCGC AAA799-E16]|uniref:Carnitine O-acetyltransferase protein n=4 Tax=Marine Group I TaxID=905826 RepID=A0A081RNL1_9ARCH|nr:carnitine O-acetyltransferase protein [Marine Group I thaumarchaeote SCGC AAA799-N04]KER06282.1 hypothetical protein AAA799E16_00941 [Marine Group I thaumarchaeote SCGC AAA799-E16]KFM15492.1 carnitine O-acetyltransferase protein [Marine Group I thaumarchaeote SCGC AAA799-D11]KFM16734.1 hypothetical protein SCCGRSA3_02177 [Marine Group I thaumarchaeote SCGC RSA3]